MVGIRGRLLALALGVGIPLAVVGLAGLQLMFSATRTQLDESLKNQAELAASAVERWILGQQQPLAIIARRASEHSKNGPLSRADLRFFASTRPHWKSIRVFDSNGATLITQPEEGELVVPTELSEYFETALLNNPGNAAVVEWRIDGKSPILALGQSTDDGGAIVALVDSSPISDIFRTVELPEGSSIVVFDPNQQVLYKSQSMNQDEVTATQRLNFGEAFGGRKTAILELNPKSAANAGIIVALARVGSTGCTLSVAVPNSILYEPARQQFFTYVIFSLLALGFAVAGSFVISRSIAFPLQRLREAAMGLGKGDFSARAPVKGSSEMKELGLAFNRMASFIEERDAKLTELDQLKSEFIGCVSHELRTPLTTIKTLTRVLQRGSVSEADRRSYLDTIAAECDRQIDLVLNLLDLTRIEAGAFSLSPKRVDVADVLRMCLTAQQHAAGIRNHRLRSEIQDAALLAKADRVALRRVICSLIENSIKYTPDGGEIVVSAHETQSTIVVQVVDSGRGIFKEDLPFIFEKFYRGKAGGAPGLPVGENDDRGDVNELPGVGLGLFLVRKIVEHLGGEISVESEVGKGSTFTIQLPRWDDDEKAYDRATQEEIHVETATDR